MIINIIKEAEHDKIRQFNKAEFYIEKQTRKILRELLDNQNDIMKKLVMLEEFKIEPYSKIADIIQEDNRLEYKLYYISLLIGYGLLHENSYELYKKRFIYDSKITNK